MNWILFWTAAGTVVALLGGVIAAIFALEQLRVTRDQGMVDVVINLDTLLGKVACEDVTRTTDYIWWRLSIWTDPDGQGPKPDKDTLKAVFDAILQCSLLGDDAVFKNITGNIYIQDLIEHDQHYSAWAHQNQNPTEFDRRSQIVETLYSFFKALKVMGNTYESMAVMRENCKSKTIRKVIDSDYGTAIKISWDCGFLFFAEASYRPGQKDPFPPLRKAVADIWSDTPPASKPAV